MSTLATHLTETKKREDVVITHAERNDSGHALMDFIGAAIDARLIMYLMPNGEPIGNDVHHRAYRRFFVARGTILTAAFEEMGTRRRLVLHNLCRGTGIEVPPGFACALQLGYEARIAATVQPEIGTLDFVEPYSLLGPNGEELPHPPDDG